MDGLSRRTLLVGMAVVPFTGAVDAGAAYWVQPRIRPGEDFYEFVNGPWLRTASIPPALQSWSDFARLDELVSERSRIILESAARAPTPQTRAFGDLYATLINKPAIERAAMAPIADQLAQIDGISTPGDIARALAFIARSTPRDPFGLITPSDPVPATPIVFLDTANPTRFVPTIIQGGLGLPDRDYYLVEKPSFAAAREAYHSYLATILGLDGSKDTVKRAAAVYALEEQLARAHRPRAELFDFAKRANPRTPSEIAAAAPGFDWTTYLDAIGYGGRSPIVVADPAAMAAFASAVEQVELPVWRDYLRAKLLSAFALAGPKALAQARFDFRERALKGVTEPLPSWRQAGRIVDLSMGQAVGAAYRRRYLPPGAQADVEGMVGLIKAAMRERIARNTWMATSTKEAALEKLARLRVEVGGPARVPDYSRLQTGRKSAWANLTRASSFAYDLSLRKLDRPVDRGEWDMFPHSINGMANPLLNKIMFSAGLLQPPFYDPKGDPAANFGALGAFIAHEVSHIFDNLGSRFDAEGHMREWWSPADRARYDSAAAALAAQFDSYEIAPGLHANGKQTLHENIADLGGLLLAFDAYQASLKNRRATPINGFSAEQRFFMGWARMWRETMREAAIRNKAAVGTHSMGRLRANTVRNVDAWYEAFNVKPGDALFLPPEKRVRIW